MKRGSGSFGEREEELALLQPRKALPLRTAHKRQAGSDLGLGACLRTVPLGSPGVQTSSGRSRPASRVTCLLGLPQAPPQEDVKQPSASVSILSSTSESWP